ncbi:MAG: hypothetical protein IAF38_05235 [Bacteroidia bacterium]|nr:hypothetical protein [Bacteroidia bacterium]
MIVWSRNVKLTWKDFTGKVPEHAEHDAFTVYNIKVKTAPKADSAYITLFAWFDKKASWVKKGKNTDYLLSHEQFHFNIAEWFARKTRANLKSEKFTAKNINKRLGEIVNANHAEMEKTRANYDLETNHSQVKVKQDEWEKKITAQIELLKVVSDTLVKIKLQ